MDQSDLGNVIDRMIEDGEIPVHDAMRQILTVAMLYQRTSPVSS